MRAGADINYNTHQNKTALILAIAKNHTGIAHVLEVYSSVLSKRRNARYVFFTLCLILPPILFFTFPLHITMPIMIYALTGLLLPFILYEKCIARPADVAVAEAAENKAVLPAEARSSEAVPEKTPTPNAG
jgi:hypothetical protein